MWPYWSLDCTACEAAAALVIQLFAAGLPLEEIEAAVIRLCVALQIEAEEVCVGAVTSFGPQLGTVQLCTYSRHMLYIVPRQSTSWPRAGRASPPPSSAASSWAATAATRAPSTTGR